MAMQVCVSLSLSLSRSLSRSLYLSQTFVALYWNISAAETAEAHTANSMAQEISILETMADYYN